MLPSGVEESGLHLLRDARPEIRDRAEQGCPDDAAPAETPSHPSHLVSGRYPVCDFLFQGGPCGVLASVQAFVLKMLLFECPHGAGGGLR